MTRKLTVALVGLATLFLSQQPQPAGAQNRACAEDSARLCPEVTPSKGAILNCLKPHMAELSEPCRRTLARVEKHRQTIEQRQGKARTARSAITTPSPAPAETRAATPAATASPAAK